MTKSLTELRSEIDAVDDQLFALLKERIGIVKQVGKLKEKDKTNRCFVRSGREAEMIRRVYSTFKGSDFAPHAAAIMWRQIITASLNVECPLKISLFSPETNPSLYWYAREYFGEFTSFSHEQSPARVIADVTDGRSHIAVLPLPDEEANDWWLQLARAGDVPKIFAYIPFVTSKQNYKKSGAIAVAYVTPEQTADDVSLFGVPSRKRLIEVSGFHVTPPASIQKEVGATPKEFFYLGSYATPIFTD